MILPVLLSVTIAFPKPGQILPPIDRCYMNGAVPRGVTNLVIQGQDVPVYRTGGWVTMVDLAEGKNIIDILENGVLTNTVVTVEKKRPPKLGPDGNPVVTPERVYTKIPYAADEPQPKPVRKDPKEMLIVLDPGHGGEKDTGAMSPHGFCEKEANLTLAKDVRRALEARGYRVLMTREKDVPVPLAERAREACERKADAFISIHHNTTAYTTDPRTVRYAVVYEWNAIGRALATPIAARMAVALEGDIPSQGVYHGNFLVTRNPQVPSCLIETDFITTPEGELAIWTPSRRRKIAEAIAEGVTDWKDAD